MSYAEKIRTDVELVVDAFCAATGKTRTHACVLTGDRSFLHRMRRRAPMTSTVDLFLGRLAGIWPADTPWPAGVPRPDPVPLPEGVSLELRKPGRKPGRKPVEKVECPCCGQLAPKDRIKAGPAGTCNHEPD